MTGRERTTSTGLTARGAATRARILEAAARLVYDRGVGATSLDDVMSASGSSKSQLYHYFADKDALIRDVIEHQSGRVLSVQQSYLISVDSMAALRRWGDAVIGLHKTFGSIGGCPVGSLANELSSQSESARTQLTESFGIWTSQIEGGLRRMQDTGELSPGVDTHELAISVLVAIQGGLLLAKTTRNSRPLELAFDMALDYVSRQLAKC